MTLLQPIPDAHAPPCRPLAVLAGHPFTSIGKGEELRSAFTALRGLDPGTRVFDIWRHAARADEDHLALMAKSESRDLDAGIRIFHINGDEVGPVLGHLERTGFDLGAGRNVVVPAWELPVYPADWAAALGRFDEVWAISRFVQDGLAAAGVPAIHIGQAAELPARPFLPRRHFGIRASSFVFLALFDLSSFSARKNPQAVVTLWRRLRARHPFTDMQLVLKAKNADAGAADWMAEHLDVAAPDVVLIDRPLSTHETHSLIAACDCFVSLHRSEGFGRGAAEALWLGRPVLATGWSGNLDYMDADGPGAVRYDLVPVAEGAYPRAEGQHWAEPDADHALALALAMLADPDAARTAARRGQARVRRDCSFRAVGLRMLERVEALSTGG